MQSSNNKRVTLRDPKASATAVLGLGDWPKFWSYYICNNNTNIIIIIVAFSHEDVHVPHPWKAVYGLAA